MSDDGEMIRDDGLICCGEMIRDGGLIDDEMADSKNGGFNWEYYCGTTGGVMLTLMVQGAAVDAQ